LLGFIGQFLFAGLLLHAFILFNELELGYFSWLRVGIDVVAASYLGSALHSILNIETALYLLVFKVFQF